MAANGDYATKTDLKALREELKGDMATLRNEIIEPMQEAIHDSETRLLKAFMVLQRRRRSAWIT